MSLYDTISSLESIGAFDIALPFVLIFTISFAVLQKINLFGGKKNIDIVVSLVLAFLAVRNILLINLLNSFLPNIAMFLIIILMFLLILGTFFGKTPAFEGFWGLIILIFALAAVVISLSSEFLGYYGFSLPPFLADLFYDYQTRAMVLFIGGLVAVIYFATGSSSSSTSWSTLLDQAMDKLRGRNQ